jgi:hypothetical protein
MLYLPELVVVEEALTLLQQLLLAVAVQVP